MAARFICRRWWPSLATTSSTFVSTKFWPRMLPGKSSLALTNADTPTLQAAYASLAETYDPENADALDAFSLPDEMVVTDIPVCPSGRARR